MKYARFALLLTLLIVALLPVSAAAQNGTPVLTAFAGPAMPSNSPARDAVISPEAALMTIRKDVGEVHLLFTVTDAQNRPVLELTREQMKVLDNSAPGDIRMFRRDSDLPLRLGLLIDTSASVEKQFAAERSAAEQFLQRLLRPDQEDRALVISFNTHTRLRQEETSSVERLASAVAGIAPEIGLTALYDAVYETCTQRLQPDGQVMRRALVLLSDGEDNYSMHALLDAVEAAQRAEIAVYALSIHKGRATEGDRILQLLAGATGGMSFHVSKAAEFDRAFAAIEQELRSQYSLAYKPAELKADGQFHRVRVQITANRDLKVHARAGYWAPRP